MPGFDGTGPNGMGPMTGGGRGFCGPRASQATWGPYGARRWGGYGYGYPPAPTREQELKFLKDEAQKLRRTLEDMNARIEELTRKEE
jgi:hypothetical protein